MHAFPAGSRPGTSHGPQAQQQQQGFRNKFQRIRGSPSGSAPHGSLSGGGMDELAVTGSQASAPRLQQLRLPSPAPAMAPNGNRACAYTHSQLTLSLLRPSFARHCLADGAAAPAGMSSITCPRGRLVQGFLAPCPPPRQPLKGLCLSLSPAGAAQSLRLAASLLHPSAGMGAHPRQGLPTSPQRQLAAALPLSPSQRRSKPRLWRWRPRACAFALHAGQQPGPGAGQLAAAA